MGLDLAQVLHWLSVIHSLMAKRSPMAMHLG
jgi:hypothetical protein